MDRAKKMMNVRTGYSIQLIKSQPNPNPLEVIEAPIKQIKNINKEIDRYNKLNMKQQNEDDFVKVSYFLDDGMTYPIYVLQEEGIRENNTNGVVSYILFCERKSILEDYLKDPPVSYS